MVIKNDRLRWFGYVEQKDDADWAKHCMTMNVDKTSQLGRPRDLVGLSQGRYEQFGQSLEDSLHSLEINEEIKITTATN